jgi:D-glycero-alpha-D-manno-heptose-7-phosphate kinase
MLITRTPFRITLGGGGTDIPEYYQKYGGSWINATIDKYVYVAIKQRFETTNRLAYSKIEEVDGARDIEHPIIREVLNEFNIWQHFELSTIADLPSGTGLGSSGAFTVGLINAIAEHHHLTNRINKRDMAELAFKVEHDTLNRAIGKQDQYSATMGGFRHYTIDKRGNVTHRIVPNYEIFDHLMLIYTSRTRESYKLLEKVKHADESMRNIHEIGNLSLNAILSENYQEYGRLMDEHWQYKKDITPDMSSEKVDKFYEKCKNYGAWGGKLMGAGGGGFLLLVVPDNTEIKRDILMISRKEFVPVNFNFVHTGSEVMRW